jgi:hypothetical protein
MGLFEWEERIIPIKQADMISIADGSLHIQTSSETQFATPSWLGEVALVASHLQKQGILTKISARVRFARRRFGRYDVIDFLAVLFGYALSGERTLETFYTAVPPFAPAFMAQVPPRKLTGGLLPQPLFGCAAC